MQGEGKTLSMVALASMLVQHHGYGWSDCIGNVAVDRVGYKALNNNNLRQYIAQMVDREFRHKIILIDEVDRVFPARFFADKEQTETLIGFWQDEKLFNYILYTAHPGISTDKIIRDSTQMICIPKYVKEKDKVRLTIVNGYKCKVYQKRIENVSLLFPIYDRWQVVN